MPRGRAPSVPGQGRPVVPVPRSSLAPEVAVFRLRSRKPTARFCPPSFRRGLRLEWLEDRCTPATLFVNTAWTGTTPGTDPDGPGPATNFGTDSFATIQNAINAANTGDVIDVEAGTYNEAVTVNKQV